MDFRRLLVSVRKRRSGMGAGLLLSLAGHALTVALFLFWPGLEDAAAPPKFALTVDLVEDRSPGRDAPEAPASPAPAAPAAAPAPIGASDTTAGAPVPKGVETPRTDPAAGSDAAGTVGDLLRGAEAAHAGAAPSTGTGGGGVFDAADAGGTGTTSLEDFIRVQITRRWQIAPDAPDIRVSLRIRINADGGVVAVIPLSDAGEDRAYRAVILAARNAALLSSPLQFPRGTLAISGDLVIELSTRDARR